MSAQGEGSDLCAMSGSGRPECAHCGDECRVDIVEDNRHFCCHGCLSVYRILHDKGLGQFYTIEQTPGARPDKRDANKFLFLESEEVCDELLDFKDGDRARVTLFLPAIHCASCVWLLENLHSVDGRVLSSEVNFIKKEAYITFNPNQIALKELAELLDKVGYPPRFGGSRRQQKAGKTDRSLLKKLAVAGFCFGNIMLMSFPEYLNPDESFVVGYRTFFSVAILLLSLPVLLYSASDYLRSAYTSIRVGTMNLDIPIALGILVLYTRSCYDIVAGLGPGYMDSFAGFVFFLLVGKWFQSKTYHYLSFERDYGSYLPMAVTVVREEVSEVVPIHRLEAGDVLLIHNNEILPADVELLSDQARIDYSFVTGESRPTVKKKGEQIYAGGRQKGANIEVSVRKRVDQSYLTQLWNQQVFDKPPTDTIKNLTDKLSRVFIWVVLGVALISAIIWWIEDAAMIPNVVTAVLIVACPCALALSFPFTFGNAIRAMGKRKLFLRNADVVEEMNRVTDIVFDKTGTLTEGGGATGDLCRRAI